jgi:hypothetical protein
MNHDRRRTSACTVRAIRAPVTLFDDLGGEDELPGVRESDPDWRQMGEAASAELGPDDTIHLTVTLANTGSRLGDEVVAEAPLVTQVLIRSAAVRPLTNNGDPRKER